MEKDMEKTKIPHYGRLTAPVKNGGAVKWTYRFSRYDADFIRKCAQALMDQTAQTERVFLVAGNGVQRDVLPDKMIGRRI